MQRITSFSLLFAFSVFVASSCTQKKSTNKEEDTVDTLSVFEVVDSSFFELVNPNAELEVLAEGYEWSEGPVWVPAINALLFSDVPANTVYKWSEAGGAEVYLKPSGYTGHIEREGEPGSNGLTLNPEGELVLCQHGDRRMSIMNAPLENPQPKFEAIATNYNGKRFNSPNDACYDSKGNLYFTDPPYGLINNVEDTAKDIPFQGVYLVRNSGEVVLLVDSLTRPNGLALTPDEKQLIVANSDPGKLNWYIFDIKEDGTLENGRIYYSAKEYKSKYRGSADGLKIDSNGNIFATGPGGVWVFNNSGKMLGIIKTGQATANCAFGEDEKTLFITADMYLMRIKLR